MGFGDYLVKKTAQSTAKSMALYANGGTYGDQISGLQAWSMSRKNSQPLLITIESISSLDFASVADIAESMFYTEMKISKSDQSTKLKTQIENIFKDYF